LQSYMGGRSGQWKSRPSVNRYAFLAASDSVIPSVILV
jgi:hypothetical protein